MQVTVAQSTTIVIWGELELDFKLILLQWLTANGAASAAARPAPHALWGAAGEPTGMHRRTGLIT